MTEATPVEPTPDPTPPPEQGVASIFDELDRPEAEAFEAETPADPPAAEAPAATPPAATTPSPTPSAAPSTTPEPTPAPAEPERTVPLTALLETRRQLEARLEAERAEREELKARLAALEKPPAAPAPEPEYLDDPKGYVDAKLDKVAKAVEDLKKTGTEEIESTRGETAQVRLDNAITAAEAAAAQAIPDIRDALVHVRRVRAEQIILANPSITADQLKDVIGQEERAMAARELNAGRNPFEFVRKFAKTLGYTPKAPAPTPTPTPTPKADAAAVAAAAAAAKGTTPTLPPDLTLGSSGEPGGGDDGDAATQTDEAILASAFSARGFKLPR